jgi:hypothetical protein
LDAFKNVISRLMEQMRHFSLVSPTASKSDKFCRNHSPPLNSTGWAHLVDFLQLLTAVPISKVASCFSFPWI